MEDTRNFTEGNILPKLLRFAFPVLFALLLQAMYGGVDLLVTGQFASSVDVSAVSTGSQIMQSVTMVITGLAMGLTILVGQKIGEGKPEEAGQAVGSGVLLFGAASVLVTALTTFGADVLCRIMQAPPEAFEQTADYVRICGAGTVFITAYNILGSIFRGIGDSKMPLITVAIACVFNVAGDLLFVAVFHMGAAGAAAATVLAQAVSVLLSLFIIRRRSLPFSFSWKHMVWEKPFVLKILALGTPIALQDLLVSISFLVILAIVNSMGVAASAGVGVAEKLCAFIMLVPSAYMQAMSAFVAQNIGAGKRGRADKALLYGIGTSVLAGIVLFYVSFFHGDMLASVFARDRDVILAGADYLKSYAIDCLLTSFMFCFVGYFNGCGRTMFVMIQGVIGAFGARIPVAFFMSRLADVTLFKIGLATPCSTAVQIILCVGYFRYLRRENTKQEKKTLQ